MKDSLMSICIPAHNASNYISETLTSIKYQTYENWEAIIVEDGTNDGTKEIVERFRKTVIQPVKYLRNEISRGPAVARNRAASESKGEWIAFLDSDDIWKPEHLSELIKTFCVNPNCELIHSGVDVFDSQTGNIIFSENIKHSIISQFPISLFTRKFGFMPSQVIITRNLFDVTCGFTEGIEYGTADLEYWFKCASLGFRFALSSMNTCLYRQNRKDALTSQVLGMAIGTAEIYDKYIDWKAIPKKIRYLHASNAWFDVARLARKTDKALARKSIVKSLRYELGVEKIIFWLALRF